MDDKSSIAADQQDEIEALKFANQRISEKSQRQAKALQELDAKVRAQTEAAKRQEAELQGAKATADKEAKVILLHEAFGQLFMGSCCPALTVHMAETCLALLCTSWLSLFGTMSTIAASTIGLACGVYV